MQTFFRQRAGTKKQAKLAAKPKHKNKNQSFANRLNYDIIPIGATVLREAGQGRNPAALSEVNCVLFSIALNESRLKVADEFRDIDPEEQSDVEGYSVK